jgi:hypothetical protein
VTRWLHAAALIAVALLAADLFLDVRPPHRCTGMTS